MINNEEKNNKKNVIPWHEFIVKKINQQNITIANKISEIDIPTNLVNFNIKENDKIFLCLINESDKNLTQTGLAKKILNIILGNES